MHTQNNAPQMKTQVETYVIEETESLIYDNEKLDKWNAHVEELGLKGQTTIVKPTKSPIPFLYMNSGLVHVFETLCPAKIEVQKFDRSPIPVEILDLIALAKRENHFERIEIWYDDKTPDPACVGINPRQYYVEWEGSYKYFDTKVECKEFMSANNILKINSSSWDIKHYLLGRWADVKASFDELKVRAKQRFLESKGISYRKEIKENQRKLEDLEFEATEYFS